MRLLVCDLMPDVENSSALVKVDHMTIKIQLK
jgi:hypothetical protein